MEQFIGVGLFALDPKKNLESYGARGRKGHGRLLSQTIAGVGPVAVDEFRRGHAALALELDFDQLERRVSVIVVALAAANEQARSLDRKFSGRQRDRVLPGLSAMHLQCFTFKDRERPGPWLKTAQAIQQIVCCALEIHAAIFFSQNRRERGLRMILRSRPYLPTLESAQGLDHQIRTDGREL